MLTIRNLTKKYKKNTALDNANLDFKKGHIYGVVGPNGAGKTTLFKMMAGLVRPTSGEILTSTNESMTDFRNKMGFISAIISDLKVIIIKIVKKHYLSRQYLIWMNSFPNFLKIIIYFIKYFATLNYFIILSEN